MENLRMGDEAYQQHMNEIAERVNDVLDGEKVSEVMIVLARMLALSILANSNNQEKRLEHMEYAFKFVRSHFKEVN